MQLGVSAIMARPTASETGLVGRQTELSLLRDGLAAAIAGQGGLFLLTGEPGIGKTRLADELAGLARAEGATILWGRCWEGDGAPAFHPWRRVIQSYAEAADAESLVGRALATRAAPTTGGLVQVLMGEVEDETNPVTGAVMNRRRDVSRPEMMLERLWFAPTWLEHVAAAYYVPAAADKALTLLRAHGVRMQQISAAADGLDRFVITANAARPGRGGIDFGTHELRTIEGYWQPAAATVPAGTWMVPMDQPLARLAFTSWMTRSES